MPAMYLYTAGEEIGARTELGIAVFPPTRLLARFERFTLRGARFLKFIGS